MVTLRSQLRLKERMNPAERLEHEEVAPSFNGGRNCEDDDGPAVFQYAVFEYSDRPYYSC
jgi:hypothetical protein